MTSPSNIEDVGTLIARLREATESSRALDAAIAVALGAEARIVGKLGWRMRFCPWHGHPDHRWQCLTRWTDSVDAALTLVPEGAAVWVGYDSIHSGKASVYPPMPPASLPVYGATPALAVCIAALEARRQAL